MKNYKIELGFSKLEKALQSLEAIAFKPFQKDRSNIDATIQRFEFTIELFWKTLKAILESKGVAVQYPKDVLREAFKGHLINDEDQWLQMLTDRNLTSHTYDEQLADLIFSHIQGYVPTLRETFNQLHAQFIQIP
jgi:nucleotidyltransferase substrate binding protein (TIGR01987 family)